MDNKKDDSYYVKLIKEDIERIIKYTKDISYNEFINDEQLIDAILFRLVQMSENIRKLTPLYKEKRNNIKWNDIIGFRNRIVHDYGGTDYLIVYEVVSKDIYELKEALNK